MKRNATIDMTHGPLLGKILLFSLPLMASNILQLLFNAAEYRGSRPLRGQRKPCCREQHGVGHQACSPRLLIGLSVGVNVVIARYLGLGGQGKEISRTLHTAVLVAMVGGVALGGGGHLVLWLGARPDRRCRTTCVRWRSCTCASTLSARRLPCCTITAPPPCVRRAIPAGRCFSC